MGQYEKKLIVLRQKHIDMKRPLLISISACLAFIMTQACSIDIEDECIANESEVIFNILAPEESKVADQADISDLTIYIFNRGILTEEISAGLSDNISIILESGTYRIYALAGFNTGITYRTEEDIRATSIDLGMTDREPPMCWMDEIEVTSGEKTLIDIRLERLTADIEISLDMGMITGLEIISLELCQRARVLHPFADGGSRIMTSSEADRGYLAPDTELERLMSGESINISVPENCQGNLLDGCEDPWAKVPENIGSAADLCTYIEMKGRWKEDARYKGEIIYRFYLGENATSNFDIRRNTRQTITLCPDEKNFARTSWKIDTSHMMARYADIIITIDDDNRMLIQSDSPMKAMISVSFRLYGHIRCVTVQDPFYTVWGHYFKQDVLVETEEETNISESPTLICDGLLYQAFNQLRSIGLYSVLDAWTIEDFQYPSNTYGTIREYLKPYDSELMIMISSSETDIRSVAVNGQIRYIHDLSEPVVWPVNIFSYWTTVPSADSRFDKRLADDGCPPGKTFEAGIVTLDPGLDMNVPYDIYLIQQP